MVRQGFTSTCRRLAVPPVKVPGVDAWLQRTSNRVSPSLDVGVKEISVQLSHGVHTHLQYQARGIDYMIYMKICAVSLGLVLLEDVLYKTNKKRQKKNVQ